MKHYVIYTAIVGNYDEIPQPLVVDDRFDYILFSNDIKESRVGVWQVRTIDYENSDRIKIARYVKTHPDFLLDGYEFSIWVDANIQIKTDYIYQRSLALYDNGGIISAVVHPERDCIYKEIFAVFDFGYETEKTLLDWATILRIDHYPQNNGLNETGIMYRKHYNSIVKNIDDLWWFCIERYSRRDQLSFNYVLWKLNVSCIALLPQGQSAHNSEHFKYISHANWQGKLYDRRTDFSLLRRYYLDLPDKKAEIENVYYKIFQKQFPKLWAWIYGQYYRLKFHIERKK